VFHGHKLYICQLIVYYCYLLFADTGKKTAYWKTRNANTVASDEEEEDKAEVATDSGGTEIQYLIKWLGFSHLHNTWESGMEYWLVVTCGLKYVRSSWVYQYFEVFNGVVIFRDIKYILEHT